MFAILIKQMIKNTYFNKKRNETVVKEYDLQNYVKPLYCCICNTTIHYTSIDNHNKTEFHKLAEHLRNITIEPIENIKKKSC